MTPPARLVATLGLALLVGSPACPADDPDADALAMTEPVACRSIRGYEDYDALDPAEVTPDEKLLVYVRSLNHAWERPEGQDRYRAHLIQDVNLRRKGQKKVVLGREKVVDLEVESEEPPVNLYVGTTISLKGFPPGDYEADLILRDALRPGSKAVATLSFRLLPRKPPPASAPRSGGP